MIDVRTFEILQHSIEHFSGMKHLDAACITFCIGIAVIAYRAILPLICVGKNTCELCIQP